MSLGPHKLRVSRMVRDEMIFKPAKEQLALNAWHITDKKIWDPLTAVINTPREIKLELLARRRN